MKTLEKIYCRLYQKGIKLLKMTLPLREPELLDYLDEIPNDLKARNINNVILITDESSDRSSLENQIINELIENNITFSIFNSPKSIPTLQDVLEASILYLKTGAKAIIALGDTSAIDCAKAAAAKILWSGDKRRRRNKIGYIKRKAPLLIAVPTSAKAGYIMTHPPVIDTFIKEYQQNSHSFIIPEIAVLNPLKSTLLPKTLAINNAIEILSHSLESYLGESLDKETELATIESIKIIYNTFNEVYNQSSSEEIREEILFANHLAVRSFSKLYSGYIHALVRACIDLYETDLRMLNLVLLPLFLEEYRPVIDKKLHKLALELNFVDKNTPVRIGADTFIKKVYKLNEILGVNKLLEDIKQEDIPLIAIEAAKEANPLYPVPVLLDNKDLEKILYRAINGIKESIN